MAWKGPFPPKPGCDLMGSPRCFPGMWRTAKKQQWSREQPPPRYNIPCFRWSSFDGRVLPSFMAEKTPFPALEEEEGEKKKQTKSHQLLYFQSVFWNLKVGRAAFHSSKAKEETPAERLSRGCCKHATGQTQDRS